MAKRSSSAKIDLSGVPVYFADQAAGLMLGHNVSKITFGIENENADSDYPRPVVTLVIQTEALIDLVSDLKLILDSEQFKGDMSKRLERSILRINNGVKASPSDYVKELLLDRDDFEEVEDVVEQAPPARKKRASKKN